ncbi:hypothetical protein HDU96_011156 [Phlyctochytrium bullatum]|nr:hypothetical protein HDU96_011156 [Phlyctochytrium bullatum]
MRVDKEEKTVTVQAGITIKALNEYLAGIGLALPNLGSISEQTLAGLISTGTHGTGLGHGILANMVQGIRLVKSTLEVIDVSRRDDEELLLHALCSLGSFGVITRVTIKVVDAFRLHFKQTAIPFDYMIANWHSLVKSSEFTRFWWFPYTDDCVFWRADKTPDPPNPVEESAWKARALGVWAYEFSLFASAYLPSLLPAIHRRHFDRFFRKPKEGIDESVKIFNFDCLFKQYVTEWAIDWNDGPEALQRLRTFIEKSNVVAHAPIEIRPYGVEVPHDLFWEGYETIMRHLGGRPHWAKAHTLTPKQLESVYPKFQQFRSYREKMDPDGLFLNDYIERHLIDKRISKL